MKSFDRAYYQRYYRNPKTRVSGEREARVLGTFICGYLAYLEQPVRRVLDAGCGLGFMRGVFAAHHPRASYTGIEVSEYLCEELGWTQASIANFRGRGRYDLVICRGVLQYLDAAAAVAAIENLGRLCRGALYLEALTAEDWRENCDRRATDGRVHLRSERFYRRHLSRHFRACGGGLFLHHDCPAVLYALERG